MFRAQAFAKAGRMRGAMPNFTIKQAAPVGLLAFGLMLPALLNRFPLIFPDSGTYLAIGFGEEYAIDRSSIYGFFLKPFVMLVPTLSGLWIAVGAQALLLAAILWPTARMVAGSARGATIALIATLIATSLAWHAGQIMPDAFTGATILLAWLAARRDPSAPGAPLLWLAAIGASLMHYTHIPLLLVAAAVTILAAKLFGLAWSGVARRLAAAVVATGFALTIQVGFNARTLERPTVAPMGPLFLYARLNEDGLIAPWLAGHCGRDAPPRLCALAPSLPHSSQRLLWGGEYSPITWLVWHPPRKEDRWPWIDEFAIANRGAIAERPLAFLANSASGAARQLVRFAVLDDECPNGCHERSGGIAATLVKYRPALLPALDDSRQVRDSNPKALLRAITTPVAMLALLALPFLLVAAWRRRDRDAFALLGVIMAALVANAALAGALSDVHDRYQSRVVWLAPFAALLILARWDLLSKIAGKWWSRGGSNPRPSQCHRDALPAELRPHVARL